MNRPIHAGVALGLLVTAGAAPVLERRAQADAAGGTRCVAGICVDADRVELDGAGLRLRGVHGHGRGFAGDAAQIEITPAWGGAEIHVEGLGLRRAPPPDPVPRVSPSATGPPRPASSRLSNLRMRVHVVDTATVELGRRGTVALQDATVDLDHGTMTGRAGFTAWGPAVPHPISGRIAARGRTDGGPRQVRGTVDLGHGPALRFVARDDGGRLNATIETPDGEAELDLARDRSDAVVRLSQFPVGAVLGPWAAPRVPVGVTLDALVIDGAIQWHAGKASSVHFEGLTARGMVVKHPALSRQPVRPDAITVDGDVTVLGSAAAEGDVVVTHRRAQVHLAGRLGRAGIDATADLQPMTCQALLDAVPQGITPRLRGMGLAGNIEGHARIRIDTATVARARQRAAAQPEQGPIPAGDIELEFPFLSACAVTHDAPSIDLRGLQGVYRHHYRNAQGRDDTLVLARGAAGYVPLSAAPLVARAFVTLEDSRFWKHDGFDREQIVNAFWHNITEGRVRRGASTITQQTARNLWLGLDRSAGRKLQEAVLTARLEAEVDKRRILEVYLNIIELGPGVHGIGPAAQYHFGKPASALSVIQAVHLAALAPAPRGLSVKFRSGEVDAAWMEHLRTQVRRMNRHGVITVAQMRTALRGDLALLDHS